MCEVVSLFAHATINLVNSGELDYSIDIDGYDQAAAHLHR
jgi:hypothetical protein